jgi:hypothetical protein
MSTDPVAKRIMRLESKITARHVRLSSSRRRILTDKAVRKGDASTLAELALARSATPNTATPEQRSAAVAAALRADQ